MRLIVYLEKTPTGYEASLNLKGIYAYSSHGLTENQALHNLVNQMFPLPQEETKLRKEP